MGIGKHWQDQTRHIAAAGGVETVETFHDPPAIIPASGCTSGGHVDFLSTVLPYVGDIQVTTLDIEGKTPGIAQAFGPYRIERRDGVYVRIVGRSRIKRCDGYRIGTGIKTRHFPEERIITLSIVVRIAPAAAITHTNVQVTLLCQPFHWTELELATVVVAKGLGDRQQDVSTAGICLVWVLRRDTVAGDDSITLYVCIVDPKQALPYSSGYAVLGMEGHAEQATLTAGADQRGDIEEGCDTEDALTQDAEAPWTFDNKQPVVPGMRDIDRTCQTRCHQDK
jgi:hypothetical protein